MAVTRAGAEEGAPEPDAPPAAPAPPAPSRGARARRVRRALRWGGWIALAALLAFLLSPTGRYLLRAAWEEGKILARRRDIASLVAAPDSAGVDAVTRAKLRLVLQARGFAADSVGLRAGQSFTTYSRLESDTLVLVLSAAYPDRLKPYTWWFPIVGHVPYKGYFDFAAARQAARSMLKEGYDVVLRPSPAFSTLGFFNDPLVSSTLHEDSLELAETVIHELTHNTFYAPGQATFNESFANFVGARGAVWFFRSRGDSAAADEEEARWRDELVLGRFYQRLYDRLDSAFKAHPDDRAARLAARDAIYRAARQELVLRIGRQLRTIGPRTLERATLNNAVLMARRVYTTDLDLFESVLAREHGDLRAAVRQVIRLAKEQPDDPYGALRGWLARGQQ